ncbi:DEAD/DEAH box helicase [Veillonella sp. VA139]|uniref:DEAD/DEAH box helicase n=1 Tax=Veillonella sp. VA139 TaxID=741830 RepID=UPI000F8EAD45|nr:DEAD/DEAH box helicase [Veillonella sp. VA139]
MYFVPHEYQRIAIERVMENTHYGLLLDMGLGKTISTLYAIEQLMYDSFDVQKVLIIAPKKVAESTWAQEARKWDQTKYLRVASILGSANDRIQALESEADIYVMNRENVQWLYEYLKKKKQFPFDMLVIDESSSFKNPQAKRFKAMRKMRPLFKRIVILTGTPAPNTLMDLWAQMYLLDGGERLGKTITEYRTRYFRPDKTNGHIVYSYRLQIGSDELIYSKIQDICMSLKAKDYLNLPDRIDNVITIELTDKERELYREMERTHILTLVDEEISALNAAAVANKLLQMANGAIYNEDGDAIVIHRQKIERLKELVEVNEGKPILVFYNFKHDLESIKDAFPKSVELKTDADVEEWNTGNIQMLLAHPASAGYGLNLQAGGHIIVWYGLTWSLEQYQQANARLHRQGQQEPVIVHHLVTKDTMDEQVMRALERKEVGQDALLEAIKYRKELYADE